MSSKVLNKGSNFAQTVLLKKSVKMFTGMLKNPKNKKILKWSLSSAGVLLMTGIAVYFYYATRTHEDTSKLKADYTVEAIPFIKEFEKDYKAANKKYAEKIIVVKGIVTETEQPVDTTMNIKVTDTTTGSYLIFAFQNKDMAKAKKLKQGDKVTIKGSFGDGIYSEIKEAYFINFQRSTVENN